MAESTRLPLRTRRILERVLAEPDAEWTTGSLRALPDAPHRAVDQAIDIMIESGVATVESTGRTVCMHLDHLSPSVPEYRCRLTGDGPRALALILEASRSYGGVIASFLFEGGEAAGAEWRRLRDSNATVPSFWRRHLPGR